MLPIQRKLPERDEATRTGAGALKMNSRTGVVVLVNAVVDMRHLYANALRTVGYDVIELDDGSSIVQLVKQRQPVAVIIDVSIAGLEGIAACERLKSCPATARTRTILISSDSAFSIVRKATDVGADEFLVKPLTLRRLVERISASH